ncbi:MAG: phage integrase SAM-like domain-containing protein, partial [Candidatus Cloacimonetes bacterium]|nr:phage integrase SAM-like domain-containing protein [Candidatus Cloacimonadota bacterium]
MTEKPEILKNIPIDNRSYKIKLRARKNRTDVWRLYLDYYENGKRQIQNLNLHISGTSRTKSKDQENYRVALAIRNKKERELIEKKTGILITKNDKPDDFLHFFKNFAESKPDRNYLISSDHFNDFIGKAQIDFSKVDYQLSEKFKNYLLAMDVTPYTAQHYFAAYKACLNQAVKLGKIEKNPAGELSIKYERRSIERLTAVELEKLKSTDCRFQNIKN